MKQQRRHCQLQQNPYCRFLRKKQYRQPPRAGESKKMGRHISETSERKLGHREIDMHCNVHEEIHWMSSASAVSYPVKRSTVAVCTHTWPKGADCQIAISMPPCP
uniref:Uncharacterized protein n=1 Tax=Eutreptiella gymnastica TaxID=73025 RepID=A0A7S4FU78_9EUGL